MCPFPADEKQQKEHLQTQLQTALNRGSVTESLHLDRKFAYCVTCMNRGQQALTALLLNAVALWPFRNEVRIAVLLFGADCATYAILHAQLWPAIQIGMIFLGSGGERGRMYASTHGVDAHDWMPGLPDEDVPAGRLGVPCLKYWHASTAKNASHMLAMHALQGQISYMCTLDCDNVVTYEFMKQAAATLNTRRSVRGLCLSCKGDLGPGLTGRLTFAPQDFWFVGGYDQDSPPSGGQDVDLRERLFLLAQVHASADRKLQQPVMLGWKVCGCALANDFADISTKHDRGFAKVANCDPQILARYVKPEKTWSKMNAQGCEAFREKRKDKSFRRNVKDNIQQVMGCWYTLIDCWHDGAPPQQTQLDLRPRFMKDSMPVVPLHSSVFMKLVGGGRLPIKDDSEDEATCSGPLVVNVIHTGLRRLYYLRRTDSTYTCKDLAGSEFPERTVEKAIRECLEVTTDTLSIIDVTGFQAINEDDLKMHSGVHPGNFHTFSRQPAWATMLRQLKEIAKRLLQQPQNNHPWTVVFVDQNGRHASVACARAFMEILLASTEFSLGNVLDLTDGANPNKCTDCPPCHFWQKYVLREQVLTETCKFWTDLV